MEVSAALLDAVIAHCRREYPNEACGVLAGPRDGAGLSDWRPMRNVAEHSRYRYAMDEVDQLAIWKALDEVGHRVYAIYHSHTADNDRGELSPEDLRHALDPDILHLILVPMPAVDQYDARLWKVVDGTAIEQSYTVVE